MDIEKDAMREAVATAMDTLQVSKHTFEEYERHHRAKPDHFKADRNKKLALLCGEALDELRKFY